MKCNIENRNQKLSSFVNVRADALGIEDFMPNTFGSTHPLVTRIEGLVRY